MKAHLNADGSAVFVALARAIDDAIKAGRPPPCLGRAEWLSEEPDDVEYALIRCRGCPVLTECRAAATTTRPTAGVWAGRLHDRRPGPARTTPPSPRRTTP